jgi:hypothetical protein
MGNNLPIGMTQLQNIDIAGTAIFGAATVFFLVASLWARMRDPREHNGPMEKMLYGAFAINFLLTLDYGALLAGSGVVDCSPADTPGSGPFNIWSHWAIFTIVGMIAAAKLVQFLWHEFMFNIFAVFVTGFAANMGVWAARSCGASDPFYVYWIFGVVTGIVVVFLISFFARRGDWAHVLICIAFPLAWAVYPLLMLFGHSGPNSLADDARMSVWSEQIGILVTTSVCSIIGPLFLAYYILPYPEKHSLFHREPVYPIRVDPVGTALRYKQTDF